MQQQLSPPGWKPPPENVRKPVPKATPQTDADWLATVNSKFGPKPVKGGAKKPAAKKPAPKKKPAAAKK